MVTKPIWVRIHILCPFSWSLPIGSGAKWYKAILGCCFFSFFPKGKVFFEVVTWLWLGMRASGWSFFLRYCTCPFCHLPWREPKGKSREKKVLETLLLEVDKVHLFSYLRLDFLTFEISGIWSQGTGCIGTCWAEAWNGKMSSSAPFRFQAVFLVSSCFFLSCFWEYKSLGMKVASFIPTLWIPLTKICSRPGGLPNIFL